MTGSARPARTGVEAERLAQLPRYPFAALEAKAAERTRAGLPVLNFGIGDPDLGPPEELRRAAERALRTAGSFGYSTSQGETELREAFARWFGRRFGVRIDPASEVAVLTGSKEGLAHLPRAVLDPGDRVAVPDPGYPVYRAAAVLAGAVPEVLPLREDEGYAPDWERAPEHVGLTYLNYPNNPTGATLDLPHLREAVERVRDGGGWLAFDNAYSELTYGPAPAPSLLQVDGGRSVGLEFHSLSKTFGVPGWRIGFAVGNAELVRALVKLKAQADSGAPRPLQWAAVTALDAYHGPERPPMVAAAVREYRARLERLAGRLREVGIDAALPGGGLYLWHPAPGGEGAAFADRLLERAGIVVTPGGAFGPAGSRYVRWAVTRPRDELERALARLDDAVGPVPAAAPRRATAARGRRRSRSG